MKLYYIFFFLLVTATVIIHKTYLFNPFRFLDNLLPLYILFILIPLLLFIFLSIQLFQNKITWKTFFHLFFINTLPAFSLLLLNFNFLNIYPYWLSLITGFYFFSLLIYASFSLLIINHPKTKINLFHRPIKKNIHKTYSSKKTIAFIILLTIFLRFGFGFFHLEKAYYSDESLWLYQRIEKFWNNIKEGDFINTRPSDKPGVTVALISGIGLINNDNPTTFRKGKMDLQKFLPFLHRMRMPLFVLTVLFIPLFYFFLQKIISKKEALLATVFIGLSPLLLGISRFLNPDSLLWIFVPLSLIIYLNYFFTPPKNLKNGPWIIILSGFFLGLGLLTKYVANFLLIFGLLIIIYLAFFKTKNRRQFNLFLKQSLRAYLAWIFIALATFFILFPGVWIKHDRWLIGTIQSQPFGNYGWWLPAFILFFWLETFMLKNKLSFSFFKLLSQKKEWLERFLYFLFFLTFVLLLTAIYFNFPAVDFFSILSSPKSAYQRSPLIALYLASFLPLFWGINLIPFIGLLFLYLPFKRKNFFSKKEQKLITILITFIISYNLASLFSSVISTVRYQIILYPLILIIASLGWKRFFQIYFIKNYRVETIYSILVITTLIVGSFALWKQKPNYFSFNNPLLPATQIINPKDMGDGTFEVATWLNQQPQAGELSIWSDRKGICKFFIGKCRSTRRLDKIKSEIPQYNYYVISSSRKNYYFNLIKQRLEKIPDYTPRVDRLYDSSLKPSFIFSSTHRPKVQFIKVIPAKNVIINK